MDVFKEFNIFDYKLLDDDIIINIKDFVGKVNINGSVLLKRLSELRQR